MDFLRHKFLEWIIKNKRATFDSTLRPFQSVEVSLHGLLPSRAQVRLTQQDEFNNKLNSLTTDTVYRTDPSLKISKMITNFMIYLRNSDIKGMKFQEPEPSYSNPKPIDLQPITCNL